MVAPTLFPQVVARRAAQDPDRTYVIDVGGSSLTYGQFHDEALRWAASFRRLGVAPGDLVATMLPTGIDAFAAWLGLAWLAAVNVPFNTAYKGATLAYQLQSCGTRVAVVSERHLDDLAEVSGELPALRLVVCPDLGDVPPAFPLELVDREAFLVDDRLDPLPEGPQRWDLGSVIYTSGTTGPSKGVLVPWGQLENMVIGADPFPQDESICYYDPYPAFHLVGMTAPYTAALAGGRVVLRDGFSMQAFWPDIRAHGCTRTVVLSAVASFLLSGEPSPDDRDVPLRHVLMIPIVPQVEEFKQRFGVEVSTLFGMSELGSPLLCPADAKLVPGLCGRRREGYEVRLVDAHDAEVPVGQAGELVVRADEPWRIFRGYLGMPEATVEANRNLWFHTGDAMVQDADGNFYFVDRFKDAIRRRGENISSMQVEIDVLAHPEVIECAAIAVPSEHSEDEVKIVVVPAEGSTLDPRSLLEFLVERMPRFMVPRYIELTDALPKTATNKTMKAKLRENPLNEATWDREAAGVVLPK